MNEENFDIILPTVCRNSLSAAIASVYRQTYPRWFLYVIADGHRYHGELDIIIDDRIKYLYLPDRHNDRGHYARKVAMEMSSSKYIAYIDDDVCWHPEHLKRHLELLQNRHYVKAEHISKSSHHRTLFPAERLMV